MISRRKLRANRTSIVIQARPRSSRIAAEAIGRTAETAVVAADVPAAVVDAADAAADVVAVMAAVVVDATVADAEDRAGEGTSFNFFATDTHGFHG